MLQTIFPSFLDSIRGMSDADWTLLLTALTLIIILIQLLVMRRQAAIMRDQLLVINKQDELLARNSSLSVFLHYDTQQNRLEFLANNHGNKAARDFYWHLYVPHQFPLSHQRSKP